MPATLKRQVRAETARPRPSLHRSEGAKTMDDRGAYRRVGGGGPDKKADVGAGTGEMVFRGGFGRGRPQ